MDEKDKRFAEGLEENLDETKAVDEAGVKIQEKIAKQPPISEEEARNLLKEEKRLAEMEYAKAQAKNRKTLIAVIVVAAILCVFGAVFALIVTNRGGDDKPDDPNNASVDTVGSETTGGDNGDQNELVSLDMNDEVVQRLWHQFDGAKINSKALHQFVTFYHVAEGDGKIDSTSQVALIIEQLEPGACKMEPTTENLQKRYVDESGMFKLEDYREEGVRWLYDNGCYAGEVIRERMKEIFDEEAGLANLSGMIGYAYSLEYDEIYDVNAGRGSTFAEYDKTLSKAEKDDKRIYLYENVRLNTPNNACMAEADCGGESQYIWYSVFDTEQEFAGRFGLKVGVPEDGRSEDYYDQIKWTFVKNGEGNYVFERLEKVEK